MWEWLRRRRERESAADEQPATTPPQLPPRLDEASAVALEYDHYGSRYVGLVATTLGDLIADEDLEPVGDDPTRMGRANRREAGRLAPIEHLLDLEFDARIYGGVGGCLFLAALFAIDERPLLVLPQSRPHEHLQTITAGPLPRLARLRSDVAFRARLRRMTSFFEQDEGQGMPLRQLEGRIGRCLVRARDQAALDEEPLRGTLMVLDMLLGYGGLEPHELSYAELYLGWDALPLDMRERIEGRESPHPTYLSHDGDTTTVVAYAYKHEQRWHSTGYHERLSRLVLEFDSHRWSLSRRDLWTQGRVGLELS